MSVRRLPPELSEFAGTAILVGLGTGSIVAGWGDGPFGFVVLAVVWFTAVALPIQLFARSSGAHLNPAVTLALAASGRFPWRAAPGYVAAQLLGALLGSGIVLAALGPGHHLGVSVPRGGDLLLIFPLEFTFTFLLVASVLLVSGLGRHPTRPELLLPAIVVGISTYTIGPWTGSALNPARSLAPALLSGDSTGILLYVVAACSGAAAAAALLGARLDRSGPSVRSAGAPDRPDR